MLCGMDIFYIPDGHRRYAVANGLSMQEAYTIGNRVLIDEVLIPLLSREDVLNVSVLCLSRVNLRRRAEHELNSFLSVSGRMLDDVISRCSSYACIRTVGQYLESNLNVQTGSSKLLTLLIGTATEDSFDATPVDLFMRSGGELRLSGAPRAVLGSDTQLYAVQKLHPEIERADITSVLARYISRYVRHTDHL